MTEEHTGIAPPVSDFKMMCNHQMLDWHYSSKHVKKEKDKCQWMTNQIYRERSRILWKEKNFIFNVRKVDLKKLRKLSPLHFFFCNIIISSFILFI